MATGPSTDDGGATWDTSEVGAPHADRPSAPERYEIRALLGRGGMGRVWLAWDHVLNREVAYKDLDLAKVSPAAVTRFLREAELTASLEHPGVVPVYDSGVRPDGGLFYVMRVIRGVSLEETLRRCDTPDDRIALIDALIDAGRAVAYAHDKGVLHRDLKPENVMLGAFGEAVVVDWGLARVAHDVAASGSTRRGAVLGTPHYMSPEAARGEPIDARGDVWSLGVILYQLIAGRRPFTGTDSWSIVGEVARGLVPPITDFAPRAPPELVAIVRKALAPDRDDRYPDAGAFVGDLIAWRTGLRVSAHTYAPVDELRRLGKRYRLPLIGLAVGLSVAGVATVVGFVQTAEERDRALLAEQDARTAEAEAVAARADVTALLQRLWVDRAHEQGDDGDATAALAWSAAALELGDHAEARGVVARYWGRQEHRWTVEPGRFPSPCLRLRWENAAWTCGGASGAWRVGADGPAPLSSRAAVGSVRTPTGAIVGAWGLGWAELTDGPYVEANGLRWAVADDERVVWAEDRAIVAADHRGVEQWRLPLSSAVGGIEWWSAHGGVLVSAWQANGTAILVDPVTGTRAALWPRVERGMYSADFAPTGDRLVFSSLAGGVGLTDPKGDVRMLLPPNEGRAMVGWSEDGGWLWAVGDERVWLWSQDGELHMAVPAPQGGAAVAVGPDGGLFVASGSDLARAMTREGGAPTAVAPAGLAACAPDGGSWLCSTGSGVLVDLDLESGGVATRRADWPWAFRAMCPTQAGPVGFTVSRVEVLGGPVLFSEQIPLPHIGAFGCGADGRWAATTSGGLAFGRDDQMTMQPMGELPGSLVWWHESWIAPSPTGSWRRWTTNGDPMIPVALAPAERAWASAGGRLATLRGSVLSLHGDDGAIEVTLDRQVADAAWVGERWLTVIDGATARVLDAGSGIERAALVGHRAPVSIVVADGDTRLVTGDHQGAAIRWDLSLLDEDAAALAYRVTVATGVRAVDGRLVLGAD
jgi:hypothetical protein